MQRWTGYLDCAHKHRNLEGGEGERLNYNMFMGFSSGDLCEKAKPFLAVIFLQFGQAGMSLISKFALNEAMSQHVFVVYRHIVAALVIAPFAIIFDRSLSLILKMVAAPYYEYRNWKVRTRMTFSIFFKIALLGLLEPAIDQNLFYTGMKYTTATFSAAMCNILPAFAFLLAWAFGLEKVNVKKLRSQVKILGTIVIVGGAMLMTLFKGTKLDFPSTKGYGPHISTNSITKEADHLKGGLMITAGSFCWACFFILQAITLRSYPAELSLTVLICLLGAIEASLFAVAVEWGKSSVWSIHLDSKLLAAVYGGVICSGVGYYVQGVAMKVKGPVFVTAFNPLSMVIVTIMGSIFLSETMYLGRIMGAAVIVIGLYLVLWGKGKECQSQSNFNNDNEAPSTLIGNETIEITNQGQVAIDLCKVTSTDGSG